MHESTLAKRLVEKVLEIARERGARRVVSVHGWIADAEQLDRATISTHFSANCAGTIADGAHLVLEIDHVEARCAECGTIYLPTGHLTLCPRCGSPGAELSGKTGVGIKSLEVED